MLKIKYIAYGIVEFILVLFIIFGFLCVVSEAEPWTISAQIWLFIKGLLCIILGAAGCALIERRNA